MNEKNMENRRCWISWLIWRGWDVLSDLKFLNREQNESLSLKLRDKPAGEIPLRDWDAAINYLSQGPPAGGC